MIAKYYNPARKEGGKERDISRCPCVCWFVVAEKLEYFHLLLAVLALLLVGQWAIAGCTHCRGRTVWGRRPGRRGGGWSGRGEPWSRTSYCSLPLASGHLATWSGQQNYNIIVNYKQPSNYSYKSFLAALVYGLVHNNRSAMLFSVVEAQGE